MPERKKQHYVPQFYMRGFTDEEMLPSYQLDHRREFPPTPIQNLCYENYFYDEEGETEGAMAELEGRFASVLQSIREEESIDVLESIEDETFFFIFLTHTHARTMSAKLESRELSTDMVQVLLEANEGAMEGDDEDMRKRVLEQIKEGDLWIEHTSVFPMQELASMYGPYLIGDLQAILLKDVTGRQFIFADHPVALDNPMSKTYLDQANIGFQAPGLQLLCPISSNLSVMMFDPGCYSGPDTGLLEVDSDTVEELNKLQLINALDAVFYEDPGRGTEIEIMHGEIENQRTEGLSRFEWFDGDDPRFDTENEVVGFSRTASEFSPELPFIKQRGVDPSPIRSPERIRIVRGMLDEVAQEAKKKAAEGNNS